MAYNKFKTEQLSDLLGIEITFHSVIPNILPEFTPSSLLLAIAALQWILTQCLADIAQ